MENTLGKQSYSKMKIHFSRNTFIWFLVFLAFVNPAYLDRFSFFGLFTTATKLLVFGYFLIFKVFHNKFPKKIVPWLCYALLPTLTTIIRSGDIRSALIYSFTIMSSALVFFYVSDRHTKDMVSGLALVMEILVFINMVTIILVPSGLYIYETEAGWWSSDVWFFGLRNSHSTFLCLACFSSVIDYYLRGGLLKKILVVITHIISVITIILLSSGGGLVSFAVYFIMLFVLTRKNRINIIPIIVKTRLVVLINIAIFVFLSFFAANTNFVNIFSLIGEQRVYTMGRRLSIWAAVWEHIPMAPFWGHGFMKAEELRWLSNLAAGAITSHNSMMDICFRGGLITFTVYCIMLISTGVYIDDSRRIDYKIKNYFAASWFAILLLLQSEGAMMSIPLLTIVGLTIKIGKTVENGKLHVKM